jgi:DNA (cytosine-5)-methyltransferase 1
VLENVAALLTRGLDRVLGTLAEIGYDAQWHCLPAAYVGAPHIRDRVFVIAYSVRNSYGINDSSKQARHQKDANASGASCGSDKGKSSDVADTDLQHGERGAESRKPECKKRKARIEPGGGSSDVADTAGIRFKREWAAEQQVSYARSPERQLEGVRSARGAIHWAVEPAVGRVANGVSQRVDRLRGLGNAVVPQVAELVGWMVVDILAERSLQSP